MMAARKRSEAIGSTVQPLPGQLSVPHTGVQDIPLRDALSEENVDQEFEDFLSAGVTEKFARVVETIHRVDVLVEYEAITKHLEPDPARTDFGTMYKYADTAEDHARRSLLLMASARLEKVRFDQHQERVESKLRAEASAALETEKASGKRTKQITDGDTKAKMAEMFPDEMQSLAEQAVKVKNTVEVLEELAKLTKTRCGTAQVMLNAVRKA